MVRKLIWVFGFLSIAIGTYAQPLSGNKYIPGDYPTFTEAVDSLNLYGVGPGGVTFNIAAGYIETGVAVNITATGTANDPIVFQKSGIGSNPKLISGPGFLNNTNDSIICISGADWITFDGLELEENALNTNSLAVEKAFLFRRASPTDGCHHITIKNCVINFNGKPLSAGISFLSVPSASNFDGSHSYNTFFNNTISNCNFGFEFRGSPNYYDEKNSIGINGSGNQINYSGPSSTPIVGVSFFLQKDLSIIDNHIELSIVSSLSSVSGITVGTFLNPLNYGNILIAKNELFLQRILSPTHGISNINISNITADTLIIEENQMIGSTSNFVASFFGIESNNSTISYQLINFNIIKNGYGQTAICIGIGTNSALTIVTGNEISDVAVTQSQVSGIYEYPNSNNQQLIIRDNQIYNLTNLNTANSLANNIRGITTFNTNNLIQNNVIYNFNAFGRIYGIHNWYISTYSTIIQNSITNLKSTGIHDVFAIYVTGSGNSANIDISENKIDSLWGKENVYGVFSDSINLDGITSNNMIIELYKNKITNLKTDGNGYLVTGTYFNTRGPIYASNNLAGNISAPNVEAASPANAFIFNDCPTVNLSYNSIYLNSTTNAANAGSSAINFTSPNTTYTLKNNIIHNSSTPSGSGLTVAIRNEGGAAMDLSSNNNLLYAGPPAANRLLYHSTLASEQSINGYKNFFAPAESDSKTENVPFLSTLGSSPDFLKINPVIPTRVESGAKEIPGLTDDFGNTNIRTGYPQPNQVNGGGTAPDIGAHEGDYTPYITDNGISAVISPANGNCYNPDAAFVVELTNYLHIPIDFSFFNVEVHASATDPGSNVTNFPPVLLNSGTLAAGASMPVTITASYPMAAPGTYSFTAYTITPEDIDLFNDTLPTPFVYFNTPGMASIDFSNICEGETVSLNLSGTSGSIQWNSSTDGGLSWNNVPAPGGNASSFTGQPMANTSYRAVVCNNLSNTVTVAVHPNPVVNMSTVDIDCFGNLNGVASFTVSGISVGYNHTWSHDATLTATTANNLPPGNYSVDVEDMNGCKGTAQGTVIEPPLLVLNASLTSPITCYAYTDGEISLSASGGTGTLAYFLSTATISTPVSGLAAGTYVFSVKDDNGCETFETIDLTEPSKIAITFSSSPSCQGLSNGSITANVSNGIAPFSYSWNSGSPSNLPVLGNIGGGTYNLSVTDANLCTHSESTVLTESVLNLSFKSSMARCSDNLGGSLEAIVTGASHPISYLWGNGQTGSMINNLSSGTYNLKVIDANNCEVNESAEVVRDSIGPEANFSWSTTGPMANFTDLSEGAVSWHWDFGNNKSSGLQNPQNRYEKEGSYTVSLFVTDSNGCRSFYSEKIIITEDIFIPNVFSPNGDGMNDWFYIAHPGFDQFYIAIFNRWGVKIWETSAPEIRWDGRTASGLFVPDGTYFYDLKATAAGKNYSTKGFFELLR